MTSFTRRKTAVTQVAQIRADESLLAGMLDALVRAARTHSTNVHMLAQRLQEHWASCSNVSVDLEPTCARVSGRVLLNASVEEGRWILPAFMSGVRSLELLPTASTDDVIRFAREMSVLKLEDHALSAFRDWVWASGAEGWNVDTQMSFIEVFETVGGDTPNALDVGSMRASSMMLMDAVDVEKISSRELDSAALRPEFKLSIDTFSIGLRARAFEMNPVTLVQLRQQNARQEHWADAELQAVLTHPAMQNAMPIDRISGRLLTAMRQSLSVSLLQSLRDIGVAETSFSERLTDHLIREGLIEVLADQSFEDPEVGAAMIVWLEQSTVEHKQEWWDAYLGGAHDGAQAFIESVGIERLLESIDVAALTDDASMCLVSCSLALKLAQPSMERLMAQVSANVQAQTFMSLSDTRLYSYEKSLDYVVQNVDAKVLERLIPNLIDRKLSWLLRALAQMSIEQKTTWPTKSLRSLIAHLDNSDEEEFLARIARRRGLPEVARIDALGFLEKRKSDTTSNLLKWHPSEWIDEPSISRRIKTARRVQRVLARGES